MIHLWYNNEITKGLLDKKYLHDGEKDIHDLINRVSSIYSDDIREDVKQALYNGDFCPAGRTLYAAGSKGKKRLTLANCFVEGLIKEDTLESISETDYNISRIGSMGGGIGFAVDKIRPKGSKINNAARISDGVAFAMRKINHTGQIVGQAGRGLALMCAINCNHPDIYEFLHLKENDEKLESMNISIRFTDDFMSAVVNNEQVTLYFKVESTGEEIKKVINAKEFFMEFCEVNWDYGDPGCIFENRVNNYSLVNGYDNYKIYVSNPCVSGDTLILTDEGYRRIDTLVGKNVNVWNGYQFSKVTPKITGYNQKMKRIHVSNGMTLDCTSYHKFVLADGSRVEAQNLKIGDKLKKWTYPVIEGKEELSNAYTKGFYSGDGTKGKAEIALYDVKQNLIDKLAYKGFTKNSERRTLVRLVDDDVFEKDFVPTSFYTVKSRLEWLAGLIDSDGCKNGNISGGISIASIDKEFLLYVQLLLTTLGVSSTVSILREAGNRLLPANDGTGESKEYECQTCYRLTISVFNVQKLFRLGLELYRVECECSPNRDANRFITVTSIEDLPDEDIVYCFNEPINHTGIFNGIMTAQCAEYMANDGNSCLLQSINLYNMVDNKFSPNASFNYDKFEHSVRLSIKMMNETQDYGYDMLPLDKHRKNVDDWRSIGLGVLGLADMFVAMGIKYGSKESIDMVSNIFDKMNFFALDESCNEAKKYGTFGKYDWDSQKKSPIIKALRFTEEGCKLYDKIERYGLRNSSLLSVAPTGSISLLLGKLSGGVEPIFRCYYERTSHQGENSNFSFKVYSRSIEDLLLYHKLPLTLTSDEIKEKFPFVVESQDIAPIDRINVQAHMQEYVDNSISSTINLPNSATVEDIFDIYINAWKQGCKGITVFRDGCKRGNILGIDKNNDSQSFKYDSIEPVSRRGVKEVEGRTIRLKTACVDKFYITINHTDDGELFEVFANPSGGCQANITTMCRLVSMALRSGVKVEEIAKELKAMKCPACQALRRKGEANIELSCGNAIAKALEMSYNKESKMIVEETTSKNSNEDGLYECPECGKRTLRLEAKCATCDSCGYSRCN